MKVMNGIRVLMILCCAGVVWAQASKGSADDLFREANAAMQAQDYSGAEFWLRDMRKGFPSDARAGLGLMGALQAQGKFADALKVAREIAPQYPRSAAHAVRVGRLLNSMDRPDEALAEYQRGLGYSPTAVEQLGLYAGMGDAYQGMGRVDDAIGAYRKAKELSGGRGLFPLAFMLGMKGDYAGEVAEYRAVLRDNPDIPAALNNLAYAFAVKGENLNEAVVLAQRAVALEPRVAVMEDTLGWVYYKVGRLEEAEETMIGALLYEGGNQGTLREHLGAVMDGRGVWTEDRRALRGLLEGELKAGDVARMRALLGKVRGK